MIFPFNVKKFMIFDLMPLFFSRVRGEKNNSHTMEKQVVEMRVTQETDKGESTMERFG